MSKEILSSNKKEAIRVKYARQHALVRLNNWPTDDKQGPTTLLYLERRGRVAEVIDSCELPILQAVENQSRQDPHFDKLPDGSVDTILAPFVHEKQLGTLQSDTVGKPLFKAWR